MHPLLARQIRDHFGGTVPPELAAFVDAVGATYAQHDEDRTALQRSMDLSSDELLATNAVLRARAEAHDRALHTLRSAVESLGLHAGGDGASREAADPVASPRPRLDDLVAIADLLAEQVERRITIERLLRSREARLRMLMHSASDAIIVIDGITGDILDANEAAQELTGYALAELQGMNHVELHPAEYHDAFVEGRLDMLEDPGRRSGEVWMLHKAGHQIPVDVTSTITEVDGQHLVQGILRDATERQRHEAMLVEAREAAEAESRLKSSFLANMSHELRTPLTAIIGFADVLLEALLEVNEDEMASYAELVRQGGERLLNTLNSVLDFARLEADRLPVEPEAFDLHTRIYDTLQFFAQQAENKGVVLRFDATTPCPVVLDPHAFDRILTNLVSNAIKFTERGEIAVETRASAHEVEIVVTDTGIGMAPAFLARVFDEFVQESGGLSRRHEGSGLGLAITRRLVELMHGTITVESNVGQGTRFHIVLPRDLGVHRDPTRPHAASQPAASSLNWVSLDAVASEPQLHDELQHHAEPTRLLLADGEPTTAALVRHLLPAEFEYTVTHPSALIDTLAAEPTPHVVLFAPPHRDAIRPVVEATRALSAPPRLIVLTDDRPGETASYATLGVDAVLYRPITRADLEAALGVAV